MSFFGTNKPIKLVLDTMPFDFGAIFIQHTGRGEINTVTYDSHALTDTEQQYSQIEREAHAIAWACEHFHLYTYDA